jgi:hypothetical protein
MDAISCSWHCFQHNVMSVLVAVYHWMGRQDLQGGNYTHATLRDLVLCGLLLVILLRSIKCVYPCLYVLSTPFHSITVFRSHGHGQGPG